MFLIFRLRRDSYFEKRVLISKDHNDNMINSQNVLVSVRKDNIKNQ